MTSPPSALGRVIMVQGTASHAGKSTLVAALCRFFAHAGYRVAPFKAQNMSNNAAVTRDGGEVGRAQAMQAMAAGVEVTVDMNPVLLKPQSDRTSQIVVLGKPWMVEDARGYYTHKAELWPIVTGALDRLRAQYDIVVVEGAGSPAEINLAQYDIVNMRVARHADAPVLVVGDIDRGGVFASLYGTVALLRDEERALIRGFIINKFRGDESLLTPGFAMLQERTGIPTLGVLPYVDLSRLPAEDALEWETLRTNAQVKQESGKRVDIAVMRLPRIANLDEFQPLACEPGVTLRFIGDVAEFGEPDLVIIPGTKSTLADLAWLRQRGLVDAIRMRHAAGTLVLGICGGFQMLGSRVVDEQGVESRGDTQGLGLLPMTTTFAAEKITRRVTARMAQGNLFGALGVMDGVQRVGDWPRDGDIMLDAYEIHMGRSTPTDDHGLGSPPFVVRHEGVESTDGAETADGTIVGTYLHGLFENDAFRRAFIAQLAARKGVVIPYADPIVSVNQMLDSLAEMIRQHLDVSAIWEMLELHETAPKQATLNFV